MIPDHLNSHNTEHAALLDCRSKEAFQQGHLAQACSIPANELFARMHELPKRQRPIHLCGDAHSLQIAHDYLTQRGHIVSDHTLWTDALKQQLAAEGRLEIGCASQQLWEPAPLLQRFIHDIVPSLAIIPGKGLDIACGAGRDLSYLASQGWEMSGIDQSADSLQRVATLAHYCKVSIPTYQVDLETDNNPFTMFEDHSLDLICVARYLHRPLFPAIKKLLKPGGIIIYQTFMVGCESSKVGRPKNPRFLLKEGELAEIFAGAELLIDEVEITDDGRPVAAFIARV